MKALFLAALSIAVAPAAHAARIPEGTEISVRLLDKVGSDVTTSQKFRAVVIAPVVADGMIVMASGTEFMGNVIDIKPAADDQRA